MCLLSEYLLICVLWIKVDSLGIRREKTELENVSGLYLWSPFYTLKDKAIYNLHIKMQTCMSCTCTEVEFSVLLKEEPTLDRYFAQDNGNELHNILHHQVWGWTMMVDEVGTTIPLSWPAFRHKQEIAFRKEVIFFTAVPWDEHNTIWELHF